jgi:hypothetical protein
MRAPCKECGRLKVLGKSTLTCGPFAAVFPQALGNGLKSAGYSLGVARQGCKRGNSRSSSFVY